MLRLTTQRTRQNRAPRPGTLPHMFGRSIYTAEVDDIRCTHCGATELQPGFIEDTGEATLGYVRWIEGALELGFSGSAKRRKRPRRQIDAYRCTRCDHLELFARRSVN